MKSPVFLALPLALAACGGGTDTVQVDNTTSAPVAAASAPAGQNWVETVVKTPEGGYRMGNPDAPIKLVEYGARSCPGCGAFAREAMTPLSEKYVASGKVSFEFRDFLVHGAPDLAAALVGTCGGPQPFFPLLEQMYAQQNDYLDKLQKISPAEQQRLTGMTPPQVAASLAETMGLIEFAKQRGIPEAKVRACLADQKAIEELAKITETASGNGTVTGTPTLILNDKTIPNATSWADVEAALKAAGA
jgi:protein-disulfide isomerase